MVDVYICIVTWLSQLGTFSCLGGLHFLKSSFFCFSRQTQVNFAGMSRIQVFLGRFGVNQQTWGVIVIKEVNGR